MTMVPCLSHFPGDRSAPLRTGETLGMCALEVGDSGSSHLRCNICCSLLCIAMLLLNVSFLCSVFQSIS